MTHDTTATRAAAHGRLPELEATTAVLTERLAELLSPAVVAALHTAPGSASAGPELAGDPALEARASSLLRDLDSMIPALRAEGGAR